MGWAAGGSVMGYPDLLPIVNNSNNNNSNSCHPLPWYPNRDLVCVSPLDRLRPVQYDTSSQYDSEDRSATLSPEPYMYHTTTSDMKELERFTGSVSMSTVVTILAY